MYKFNHVEGCSLLRTGHHCTGLITRLSAVTVGDSKARRTASHNLTIDYGRYLMSISHTLTWLRWFGDSFIPSAAGLWSRWCQRAGVSKHASQNSELLWSRFCFCSSQVMVVYLFRAWEKKNKTKFCGNKATYCVYVGLFALVLVCTSVSVVNNFSGISSCYTYVFTHVFYVLGCQGNRVISRRHESGLLGTLS